MAKFVPCRYPGCPSLVEARSASCMCRVHLHAPGICRCSSCKKRKDVVAVELAPLPEPRSQHPDRITVQVATHVTTSTAENKVAVTLRRAPWQREAAHG